MAADATEQKKETLNRLQFHCKAFNAKIEPAPKPSFFEKLLGTSPIEETPYQKSVREIQNIAQIFSPETSNLASPEESENPDLDISEKTLRKYITQLKPHVKFIYINSNSNFYHEIESIYFELLNLYGAIEFECAYSLNQQLRDLAIHIIVIKNAIDASSTIEDQQQKFGAFEEALKKEGFSLRQISDIISDDLLYLERSGLSNSPSIEAKLLELQKEVASFIRAKEHEKEEEKSEKMTIATPKDDDLVDFFDLRAPQNTVPLNGKQKSSDKQQQPSKSTPPRPGPEIEAPLAQNYEERAKEQRIELFIELRKHLDKERLIQKQDVWKIENELDLLIIEREIQCLENEIRVLKKLSKSTEIEQQIQEQEQKFRDVLEEKSSKLNSRCACLDSLYRTAPFSKEQGLWLQKQQIDCGAQIFEIRNFIGVSKPDYQTICTPERRKQELEEILTKEKSLVLKINLRTLCTELLRNLHKSKPSKKQSFAFPFSQKEKEPNPAQKEAFEQIEKVARLVQNAELVEIQENLEDHIAQLEKAINLFEQAHPKGISLDIVAKAKALHLELLKLKKSKEEIEGEKESLRREKEENETHKPTISSSSPHPEEMIYVPVSMEKEEAEIEEKKLSPAALCDLLNKKILAAFSSLSYDELQEMNDVNTAVSQIQLIAIFFSSIFGKMPTYPAVFAPETLLPTEKELREDITNLKYYSFLISSSKVVDKAIKNLTIHLQFELCALYARQEFEINLYLLKEDAIFIQTILDYIIAIRNARDEASKCSDPNEQSAAFRAILIKERIQIVNIKKTIKGFLDKLKENASPELEKLKAPLNDALDILKKIPQLDTQQENKVEINPEQKDEEVDIEIVESGTSSSSGSGSFENGKKATSNLPEQISSSLNPIFTSTVVAFFGEHLSGLLTNIGSFPTDHSTAYKIACAVAITTLVVGVAVGITAATCGIVPAALVIAGAIVAHAAIAEGVLALGALVAAGFFGRKCAKKELKEDEKKGFRHSNSVT